MRPKIGFTCCAISIGRKELDYYIKDRKYQVGFRARITGGCD